MEPQENQPNALADSQHVEFSFDSGETIRCERAPFMVGGEGELFRSSDRKYVVKIFYRPDLLEESRLRALLGKFNLVGESTYWSELFGWPRAIIKRPSLGVVFCAQQRHLRGLDCYLSPKMRIYLAEKYSVEHLGKFENYVTLAMKMAQIVDRLEQYGLVHLDLSPHAFVADIPSGSLLLTGNDALMIPGFPPPQIGSTWGYMAPELVTRSTSHHEEIRPTDVTNKHSLATLIYELLLLRHPLEGPKIHSPDPVVNDAMMHGEQALFIEHPSDVSNRPLNLVAPYSSVLSLPVQRLVERAFIDGLHTPEKRPSASDWVQALFDMGNS